MKLFMKVLTLFVAGISTVGFGEKVDQETMNSGIQVDLSIHRDCISHVNEEKVYFKPESIQTNESALYLESEGVVTWLPFLYFDASGYYLTRSQIDEKEALFQCSNTFCANKWNVAMGNLCPKCGSPGTYIGVK